MTLMLLCNLFFGSFEEIHHFDSDKSVNNDYILIKNRSISEDSTEAIVSIMPELEERIIYKSSSDDKPYGSMPELTEHTCEDTSSDKEDKDSIESISKTVVPFFLKTNNHGICCTVYDIHTDQSNPECVADTIKK